MKLRARLVMEFEFEVNGPLDGIGNAQLEGRRWMQEHILDDEVDDETGKRPFEIEKFDIEVISK